MGTSGMSKPFRSGSTADLKFDPKLSPKLWPS